MVLIEVLRPRLESRQVFTYNRRMQSRPYLTDSLLQYTRRKCSLIARCVLVVFLCNALFSAVASAALNNQAGSKVLLCTSNGYQWVAVGSEQPDTKPGAHCVFCLNLDDDDEPFSSDTLAAIHSISWAPDARLYKPDVINAHAYSLAFPRAPPAIL